MSQSSINTKSRVKAAVWRELEDRKPAYALVADGIAIGELGPAGDRLSGYAGLSYQQMPGRSGDPG